MSLFIALVWLIFGFELGRQLEVRRLRKHGLAIGFMCRCGRFQRWAPKYLPNGVTFEEAGSIGWMKVPAHDKTPATWLCPFCTPR